MDDIMGMIKAFGGNFAPVGYLQCSGQLLPIAQYTALFSILGTTYGGNGTTTFALPNLNGRLPLGSGQQDGTGPSYALGQAAGTTAVTLTPNNLPPHTHAVTGTIAMGVNDAAGGSDDPGGKVPGINGNNGYYNGAGDGSTYGAITNFHPTVSPSGSNAPVSTMQPYVAMTYIICVEGIYPSHP
jgi:microcystin-dependent protein